MYLRRDYGGRALGEREQVRQGSEVGRHSCVRMEISDGGWSRGLQGTASQ